jgi:hypothetical protein
VGERIGIAVQNERTRHVGAMQRWLHLRVVSARPELPDQRSQFVHLHPAFHRDGRANHLLHLGALSIRHACPS